MIEENQVEAEKMINEGYVILKEALAGLTKKLKCYGFSGTIALSLTVSIKDKIHGHDDTVLDRKTTSSFSR